MKTTLLMLLLATSANADYWQDKIDAANADANAANEAVEKRRVERIAAAKERRKIKVQKQFDLLQRAANAPVYAKITPEDVEREKQEARMAKIRKEIADRARAKWPNDYEMQVYIIKNQIKAFNRLGSIYREIEGSEVNMKILVKALKEWDGDYEMILYVYNNQVEALLKLKKQGYR